MSKKLLKWVKKTAKANLACLALQAAVYFGLNAAGVDAWLSLTLAKSASWAAFGAALLRCR